MTFVSYPTPKGFNKPAQGRERSERTLGYDAQPDRLP